MPIIRKKYGGEWMECKPLLTAKGENRCCKVLEVAYQLFLKNGYEKVSMNDIVKHSGGSLATLYKHFGNKEQLFINVLEQKSEELFGEWERQSMCYEGHIEEFLTAIGKLFLDLIITDDAILFHRLIVSLGYLDDTKLKKVVIHNIMSHSTHIIAAYLENEKAKGRIEVEDTMILADQFLNALEGPFLFPRLLGIEIDVSEQRQAKALKQIVTVFSRGLLIQH